MRVMFWDATTFNRDAGGWEAAAFNQDVGGWDTCSVASMKGSFSDADAFDQDAGS